MRHLNKCVLFVLIIASCAFFVASQSSQARCFKFTWLGPQYNNESVFLNATCSDATQLASGVPCAEPLVASYDGSWPSVEYIWTHHSDTASCLLADSDVCAEYTYYFNGIVENSTYMCTRVVDAEGVAITSGCFQQVVGSSTTRVCVCRSLPGGVPCNSAHSVISSTTTVLSFVVAILLTANKEWLEM